LGLLDSGVASSWLGYRAEPPDFLPLLGETPVDGYMLAVGCGGNGVIEGPMVGQDMAIYIMTEEKTPLVRCLPLSRYAQTFDLTKVMAD
jgi:glycine/D-amino acid oxidase-like deaminating enzyme